MPTAAAEEYVKKLDECAAFVASRIPEPPEVVVILGSGLGGLTSEIANPIKIGFSQFPHFPRATVAGHEGSITFGRIGKKSVAILEGRVHLYEGYKGYEVVFPLRALRFAGAKMLLVTNSAGGMNPDYKVGDFMVIDDHIGMFADDPTEGVYHERLGSLFYDMFAPYDPELKALLKQTGKDLNIPLHSGVYCFYRQCSYETRAELRAMVRLGADAVAKSVVPEVLAARQGGMKVVGISFISTELGGDSIPAPLTHQEIVEAGRKSAETFHRLLAGFLKKL